MNADDFEARMRALEHYHALRILPGAWVVVRVDGRSFSRLTERAFEKPFDRRFHEHMQAAARALLEELAGVYAYTESDEISVLCRPEWALFDREVEKVVSVSAGIASAAFPHAAGAPAHFDGRVWVGVSEDLVVDYFQWRQSDAARCALAGCCYWVLRKAGRSAQDATRELDGKSIAEKNEFLFRHGLNFNDAPLWQRRGAGLYWETYEKAGWNPVEQRAVAAVRRRVKVDEELPMKEEYAALVRGIMARG